MSAGTINTKLPSFRTVKKLARDAALAGGVIAVGYVLDNWNVLGFGEGEVGGTLLLVGVSAFYRWLRDASGKTPPA